LPGLINADGSPRYPGFYPDYIVNHERVPGVGMLAGWRGQDGDKQCVGERNPRQIERYISNGCFWRYELPDEHRFYRHANKGYLDWAHSVGFIARPSQVIFQLYSEPLQRFRLAARGHGAVQPPDRLRARVDAHFDPLPIWYPPFEGAAIDSASFPLHAVTQRPMAMYHSWDSQNAWLRQIHGHNRLYLNRRTAERQDLRDDDWVWVISHHGRIRGQLKLMEGVNEDTVWTWNAIGKRKGAWNLAADAAESGRGFLLNHVISELLPPQPDGHRYANSDPITGQAAWYDLRVRVEKAKPEEAGETYPTFATLTPPPGMAARPTVLTYGAEFRERD
jgi:anaerobic selenocysteine-containing dehydrogenase